MLRHANARNVEIKKGELQNTFYRTKGENPWKKLSKTAIKSLYVCLCCILMDFWIQNGECTPMQPVLTISKQPANTNIPPPPSPAEKKKIKIKGGGNIVNIMTSSP